MHCILDWGKWMGTMLEVGVLALRTKCNERFSQVRAGACMDGWENK